MNETFFENDACRAAVSDGIVTAVFSNPPVNAISQAVRDAIIEVCTAAAGKDCRAVIFACEGRTFFSGADIREFGQEQRIDLPKTLEALDACPVPMIALLHGTVLGGGLEVALRCDLRLAHPQCRFGFPEVKLGLIPGAGGTQLLPRIVPAEIAAQMVCGGEMIDAALALARGLIDHWLPEGDIDLHGWIDWTKKQIDEGSWELAKRRLRDTKPVAHDGEALAAAKVQIEKRARGQESPLQAFAAIEAALAGDIDAGMAREREIFLACKASPQSASLRHIFFAEKASSKIEGDKPKEEPSSFATCAVIGCGTMGAGIGAALLRAADNIILIDSNQGNLEKARAAVMSRLEKMRDRGQISESRANSLEDALVTTDDFGAIGQADVVIEAVFEDLEVKREVFAKVAGAARPDAILATNTSYIDPNEIFHEIPEAKRCLGLHFFSPADVMKLLEIVALPTTGAGALATATALAKKMGKIAVHAKPSFGFAANRSYMAYGQGAQELLLAGNTPEEIDRAMTGFGMAMGPLAVLDLSGIDVGHKGRMHNPEPPADPGFYLPAAILVERGELGRKTGMGFYRYQDGRADGLNEAGLEEFAKRAAELGIARAPHTADEIVEHVLSGLVSECQRLIDQGVCQRPDDMDVIWVNGYGFPRWRGGPMFWQGQQAT